jgi:hypothetical protein
MPAFHQTSSGELTPKLWDKKVHEEVQNKRFFTSKWIGNPQTKTGGVDGQGTGAPIMEYVDLKKGNGDKIRLPFEANLDDTVAAGRVKLQDAGDNREEAPEYGYLDVDVDEFRKAVRIDGTDITSQRLSFDAEMRTMRLLTNWMAQQEDDAIFSALRYGRNKQILLSRGVSNNAQAGEFALIDHPNKIWNDGSVADFEGNAGRLLATAGNSKLSKAYLNNIILYATNKNFPRIVHNGDAYWLLIVSPDQYLDLLNDTQLESIFKDASIRANFKTGKGEHPFLSESKLVYRDLLILESKKITNPQDVSGAYAGTGGGAISWTAGNYSSGTNNSITFAGIGAGTAGTALANATLHEAFLLGANAIGQAYGKVVRKTAKRDNTDYGYIEGMSIRQISGARRGDFVMQGSSSYFNQSSASVVTYIG